MNHVISFSTGLSSALTVERVLQRYKRAYVVFMDTLIEDDDNYRFSQQVQARWRKLHPGMMAVSLREGRDPYRVSSDQNMIFNQKIHACTHVLKIEQFKKWLKTLVAPPIVHIGIGFDEVHRCEAITRNYNAAGYEVDYPLLWRPVEHRPLTEVARADWGIEPPRMYEQGYNHANCGGRCVAQGIGDWVRTLTHYPERFAEVEEWEREMRKRPGLDKYAICRDQSRGEVKPRTLESIRLEYEERNRHQLDMFDLLSSGPGCVSCGIGDLLCEQGASL